MKVIIKETASSYNLEDMTSYASVTLEVDGQIYTGKVSEHTYNELNLLIADAIECTTSSTDASETVIKHVTGNNTVEVGPYKDLQELQDNFQGAHLTDISDNQEDTPLPPEAVDLAKGTLLLQEIDNLGMETPA